MKRYSGRIVTVFTLLAIPAAWLGAGQLTPPPGPVAPTMKTLDDLSAEHAAIRASMGGGSGGIKRIVRGVVSFAAGEREASVTLPAQIVPDKSLVVLECVIYVMGNPSQTATAARAGACVDALTTDTMNVSIDYQLSVPRKLAYQIIEYY